MSSGREYNEEGAYGDWADEYGNVVCQNCSQVNDLPDGSETIECYKCHCTIDTQTGEVLENPEGFRHDEIG